MAEKDSGISFTVGFIVGAAIGVAIGFLYAPKPGKETRELLKDKAEKTREKVGEVAEKAGARTVLYMGWPFDPRKFPTYENEDPFDYNATVVRTVADEFGVAVAPIALAWERAMESCPDVELYHDDADHPTTHGTYLSASVMYATLFGQSPVGLAYRPTEGGGVDDEAAACLQSAAWDTVVDYQSEE